MDPVANPFAPGAGAPPPELVGRDGILQQTKVLLGRVREKKPEKSFFLIGLRGVGKTVLLNEMARFAQAEGYRVIHVEAHEEKSLAGLLVPSLRRLLFDLDRMASAGDKAKRAMKVLKGFVSAVKVSVGEVELGLDIDAERGVADSGDLETDLPELLVSVAEAAEERRTVVALLIDEVQYLGRQELSALIMSMHKMQQRQLPLVLMGAGLPIIPALAGQSKSYAERLFSFPTLGPLSPEDARKALRDPVRAAGADIEERALTEIVRLTQGYPYFLQEWGYQAWNHALTSPVTFADVQSATAEVVRRLDESFFRVRFDRLTPREKEYLRAMAHLGPGPHPTGLIAQALGAKVTSLGPLRASLIKKGMIYSPAHGLMAFTVPLFDQFMRRAMPEFRSAP